MTAPGYGQGLVGPVRPNVSRLHQLFTIPPFSVLDSKQASWQQRRREWLNLGIQSEVGRSAAAYSQDGINEFQARTKRNRKVEPGGGRSDSEKNVWLGGGRKPSPRVPRARHNAYDQADGRNSDRPVTDDQPGFATGTSIFDPVLAEVCLRWWAPPGGIVLDPFAGGSVRGIVASVLGFRYYGIELREVQVAANRAQVAPEPDGGKPPTVGTYRPKWVVGDAAVMLPAAPLADFLFTCPPYGNLEEYSDDPADLSNKPYPVFREQYAAIIAAAVARLRQDAFAVVVTSNFRDQKTRHMNDLVGDTTRAFQVVGCGLWSECVLLNSIGSAAMRTNGTFLRGNRKIVRIHQCVSTFIKGDPAIAAASIPAGPAGPATTANGG